MHLNERSLGPLMCVTLSESLVLDGRLREEGEEAAEAFSPSISRVLVPLANTAPLCRLLPECNACVLCQSRAVVAGPDRETSLAFTGLVSGGNGDRVGLHLGPVTQSLGILTSCAFPLGIITAAKDGFYLETWKL